MLLPAEITIQGQLKQKCKACSLNGTCTSNSVESIRLSVITKSPLSSRPLQTNYFTAGTFPTTTTPTLPPCTTSSSRGKHRMCAPPTRLNRTQAYLHGNSPPLHSGCSITQPPVTNCSLSMCRWLLCHRFTKIGAHSLAPVVFTEWVVMWLSCDKKRLYSIAPVPGPAPDPRTERHHVATSRAHHPCINVIWRTTFARASPVHKRHMTYDFRAHLDYRGSC